MKINKPLFPILLVLSFTSCYEVIEKSLSNSIVTLSAPVDKVVSSDSIQTLYWQPVESAQHYQLQVVAPRFDSIIKLITDTTISQNQYLITLQNGNYQWRVRALNNSSSSPFSAEWTILIQ